MDYISVGLIHWVIYPLLRGLAIQGDGRPELQFVCQDICFNACCFQYSLFYSHLLPLLLCLISFMLFPCAKKHLCTSSAFPIAILNKTWGNINAL